MKMKYINWNTQIFAGFYDSFLYNSDILYNINANTDENESGYDFAEGGFESFCNEVAEQCVDALFDNIEQDDNKIIESMKFVKLHSPRFYNFETDKIEMEIEIDWEKLNAYIAEHKKDFAQYLQDNFTSYDGFISFVPNTIDEFFAKMPEDFERLSQVVIEFYILKNLDCENYENDCYEIALETIWRHLVPVEQEQ